jgi:NAD(P)-dependent dehydrogenase (short-subunit alcohol dehydrogenase family)
MGAVHVIQAFLPRIKAQGEGGHIVFTASAAPLFCPPGIAPYNASKSAVIALGETLAAELAGTAIAVTVLCPEFVRTRIATSARNRPPRFGAQLDQSAAAQEQLAAFVDAGLDPRVVARQVMTAIRDNDLYVITHPESRGVLEDHFHKILAAFDKAAIVQG